MTDGFHAQTSFVVNHDLIEFFILLGYIRLLIILRYLLYIFFDIIWEASSVKKSGFPSIDLSLADLNLHIGHICTFKATSHSPIAVNLLLQIHKYIK